MKRPTRRLVRKVFTPTAMSGKLRGELRALADALSQSPLGGEVGYVQRVLIDQLVGCGFIREDDPAAPDYWQIIGALDAAALAGALRAMAQNRKSARVLDFFKARVAYQRVCLVELREDRQTLVDALTAMVLNGDDDPVGFHLAVLRQHMPLDRAALAAGVAPDDARERVSRLTGAAWRALSPPSCAEAAVMAAIAGGLPTTDVAAAARVPQHEVVRLRAVIEARVGRPS